MIRAGTLRAGLRRARFARDARGVTAVEFALLALPIMMLIGAIIEASMLMLSQQLLDNGLDRAARAVFTGVYQNGANDEDPAARLITELCNGPVLFDCSKLKIEMTTSPTFSAQSASSPYDDKTGTASASFGTRFQCPKGSDVVTIRAAVIIPRFFTFTNLSSSARIGTTEQMISSTAVFRAEPYPLGTC